MTRQKLWTSVRTWSILLLGTALYGFGIVYFIVPNRLMEGGVTGVGILLLYAAGLPASVTTLVLNLPLFWLGWRKLGFRAMIYTFGGTVSLSVFLWLWQAMVDRGWLTPFTTQQDFILVVLYAGVTLGAGLGLVFYAGGTTGGVDIIARIANRRGGISMGQFILLMDVVILGTSLIFIPKEKVLYTLVSVFISARVIDFVQEGAYAAKAFTILCRDPEKLAAQITSELERGVTLLNAVGAYSGEARMAVYCVVSRFEVRKLKSLVRQHDRQAFIVIADVHDVLGEGFREE